MKFVTELIMLRKIVIYMDDILIFSQTMDEYRSIMKQVLQILANNKLLLHPKKCKFHQTKIKYLGVILSQDSIDVRATGAQDSRRILSNITVCS